MLSTRLHLAWHISIWTSEHTRARAHAHIWCHLPFHKTSGKKHWRIRFGPHLSRCFRAVNSLPRKRLAGSEKTIHRESMVPLLLPPLLLLLLLRAFYFTALSVNCRRIGSSTGSPACCAPSGDELLLSRASRSRGLTLCGLSSRGSGLEKPK